MSHKKEVKIQTPESIDLGGMHFDFVKVQRSGRSAVYKGRESYLRIGSPDKIHRDLELHKRMQSAGFPIAKLLVEGESDGKAYFIESSVGEKTLSKIFEEETETAGTINQESLNQFLNITEKFARAQLRTQISERDFDGFAQGIHLDVLCKELPQYAEKIQTRFKGVMQRTGRLPFVMSHGDFNPHNLYPGGAIDLEDSYYAPFGHDLIGGVVSIDYFPDSRGFEFFAKYQFSADQQRQYFALLDGICRATELPPLSNFKNDFEFTRGIWLLVRMKEWPKIQKFRYDLFIERFLKDASGE